MSNIYIAIGVLAGAGALVYVVYRESFRLKEQEQQKSIQDTQGVDAKLVEKWKSSTIGGPAEQDQFTRELTNTQNDSKKASFNSLFKQTAQLQQTVSDTSTAIAYDGAGASIVTSTQVNAVPQLPGALTGDPGRSSVNTVPITNIVGGRMMKPMRHLSAQPLTLNSTPKQFALAVQKTSTPLLNKSFSNLKKTGKQLSKFHL
jgi:hypothetical protein